MFCTNLYGGGGAVNMVGDNRASLFQPLGLWASVDLLSWQRPLRQPIYWWCVIQVSVCTFTFTKPIPSNPISRSHEHFGSGDRVAALLLLKSANLHPSLTPAFAQLQPLTLKTGRNWPKYALFIFPKGQGTFLGQIICRIFGAQGWPFWGHGHLGGPRPPLPPSAARYVVLRVRLGHCEGLMMEGGGLLDLPIADGDGY